MKHMLAFAAHHDDIELRAGGTVARYVQAGYEVHYIIAVDGAYVAPGYVPVGGRLNDKDPDSVLRIREEESRAGAMCLGAEPPLFLHYKPSYYWHEDYSTTARVHFTGTPDDDAVIAEMKRFPGRYSILQAQRTGACVEETAALIGSIAPEIVLTQQVNDLHLEHYATAALVYAACRKLYREGLPLRLYAWEVGSNGAMLGCRPEVVIDITATMERKLQAIRCFPSQTNYDPELHTDYVQRSGRFWGDKIGVRYAEPFCRYQLDGGSGWDFSAAKDGHWSQAIDCANVPLEL